MQQLMCGRDEHGSPLNSTRARTRLHIQRRLTHAHLRTYQHTVYTHIREETWSETKPENQRRFVTHGSCGSLHHPPFYTRKDKNTTTTEHVPTHTVDKAERTEAAPTLAGSPPVIHLLQRKLNTMDRVQVSWHTDKNCSPEPNRLALD